MHLNLPISSLLPAISQIPTIAWVGLFFFTWLIVWLPIAIPLAWKLKWQPFKPLTPAQKLHLVASLYAIVPVLLWGFAALRGQSFAQYGLVWSVNLLTSGLIGIGIAIMGLFALFTVQQWQTWSCWQQDSFTKLRAALLPSFLIGLWISATEELVFRGFLVNQLQMFTPLWVAAIGSSLIFAVLHLLWERQETLPQLPGLWLLGMVLVLARWADDGWLGLAIGLHAGWVGGLISLDSTQAIQYQAQAPIWFVGMAQKPLAGLGGISLLCLTAGLVWVFGSF